MTEDKRFIKYFVVVCLSLVAILSVYAMVFSWYDMTHNECVLIQSTENVTVYYCR